MFGTTIEQSQGVSVISCQLLADWHLLLAGYASGGKPTQWGNQYTSQPHEDRPHQDLASAMLDSGTKLQECARVQCAVEYVDTPGVGRTGKPKSRAKTRGYGET